jgi:hypothetical protein
MPVMRLLAVVLAASCASNSYEIRGPELARLAQTAPETRGARVRVTQQLGDADVGPEHPVTTQTEIVVFPEPAVYGPERRRYYSYGGTSGGGGFVSDHRTSGGGSSGPNLGDLGNSTAGDGKAEAIALLATAAVIMFVAAGVEGSRFDGYAQLHPMHPVHLFGKDGGYTVLPLAWIDPQTAAWADHAIVRETEGPWRPLERAPLDRQGWTYAMLVGTGTYTSVDGSKDSGFASTLQLGYFPDQKFGVLANLFLGWRNDNANNTLLETRYTLELDAYPVQAGPLHLGLFGGGGLADRIEDNDADPTSVALQGGALVQLDINTRLAITARFGATYAHAEQMTDALVGLSVY